MSEPTPYDELAYPSHPYRQTHPDRLAAHAALFGLPFTPLDGPFTLLDIGAGDGGNVIPLAVAYPHASFVAFDLSREAIGRGRRVVEQLGLTNMRLFQGDITTVELPAGGFDYVVAHGVYAWAPAPVRDALMALIGRALAPAGVGFVSYNCLPGARPRQTVRELLLWRLRGVEGLAARVDAAHAYLQSVLDDWPADQPHQADLKLTIRDMLERPRDVMAHDELGDVYHPVLLHQFCEHAAANGLQFLCEAEGRRAGEGFRPEDRAGDESFDVIANAQEADFRTQRPFRQSLVVHAVARIDRRLHPERLLAMHASSNARRNETGEFDVGPSRFQVTDERLAEALAALGQAWPGTLPIAGLIDDEARAAAMLRMYFAGALELHTAPAPYSTSVSDHPAASPLARLQAAAGAEQLATLRHGTVEVKDAFSRDFIAGLDGARSLDELTRDVAAALNTQAGGAVRRQVETNLGAIARMPLLIA